MDNLNEVGIEDSNVDVVSGLKRRLATKLYKVVPVTFTRRIVSKTAHTN
jgi:hypothetical protein